MADYIKRDNSLLIYISKGAYEQIQRVPAADVVPMVRCEDCRFLRPDVDESYLCRMWHETTDLDGFCYLGRRRDR